MSDKAFFDTNMLIYFYSSDEIKKSSKVKQLLEIVENCHISTQVVNEFINVMIKKRKVPIDAITKDVQPMLDFFTLSLVKKSSVSLALKIVSKYRFSYYDSLIVTSALESECPLLYSEDMHHQQKIENKLVIINPFKM